MVAIKANQAAQYLKNPPEKTLAYLFFGTDPGLVSENAQGLAKMLAARENPPGEVLRLDDAELDGDPGRLAVELNTRPMFSGRKIVRATAGRRISAATIKPILDEAPIEGVLIVEAQNLKPSDALRALFEASPAAAAIGCYADTASDIDRLVTEILKSHGLAIDSEARSELVNRLGADRALSRNEIEKLALYSRGRTEITLDDVLAVTGDAASLSLEQIAESAAAGQASAALTSYGRAIASGESAQVIILITQRYFLKLHKLRSDIDAGQPLDGALSALRPPVHFRQRDTLARHIRRWPRTALDSALKRIGETAKAARLSSGIEDTLGERLILALSMMAPTSATSAARRR